MFLWNESVVSRGPQEYGSCILYFFKKFVTTQHLIMYSDQCGGQNLNKAISFVSVYLVLNTRLNIVHAFLVS